ncbi:MAG: hypothetical protein AAFY21_20595, partial [Cyanobacteria bacterium J06641_2]
LDFTIDKKIVPPIINSHIYRISKPRFPAKTYPLLNPKSFLKLTLRVYSSSGYVSNSLLSR